jgi:DnaJ-class molecular chaperone
MLQPCPKCKTTGKMKTEQPVSMTQMGTVEEECDLCDGTGWVEEDLMPQVIARLDRIIGILNKIAGGK